MGCSIISTTRDHEAWPEVKPVRRRALETRRKIAGGLLKLDALRPSSPPKASCQQSFRLDLPHAGGISEGPVVSVVPDWHDCWGSWVAVSRRVWPGWSSR